MVLEIRSVGDITRYTIVGNKPAVNPLRYLRRSNLGKQQTAKNKPGANFVEIESPMQ
jgi:hypothetical protein